MFLFFVLKLFEQIWQKVEKKIDTANPEAYEFYLKAKHKYDKRENTDDIEIVRKFLNKAIQLDDARWPFLLDPEPNNERDDCPQYTFNKHQQDNHTSVFFYL